MTHQNHKEFIKALEKQLPRRHYIVSWEENVDADWWTYRVDFSGQKFKVNLGNEYDLTDFECRSAVRDAFRTYGCKLTGVKATR